MKEVMMVLKLVNEHDNVLRTKCDIINFENADINLKVIIPKMMELMLNSGGIGLAAPQIGLIKQVFVMSINNEFFTCINPEIIVEGLDTTFESEGCLSFPKLYLKIKRPTAITVKYYDVDGICIMRDMSGIMARCFSHELDHLNGITFDTQVSKLRLKIAKRKRIKLNK